MRVRSLTLLLLLLAPLIVFAQTSLKGRVRGRVCEEKRKPACVGIAKVKVRITNSESGARWFAETDKDGYYNIQPIDPGTYYIVAESPDRQSNWQPFDSRRSVFRNTDGKIPVGRVVDLDPPPIIYLDRRSSTGQTKRAEILLAMSSRVNGERALFDAPHPLSLNPPAEDAVQAAPPGQPVKTDLSTPRYLNRVNATRDGNFNREIFGSLPLPGIRTIESLAFLLPGVAPPPQTLSRTPGPGIGSGVGTSGQFVVNGLRSRANNFTVDGSDNNDEDIGVRRQGFTSLLPQSVESLDELHIITLLPTPQFGRNLGAQVNLISRYGTNRFHGTVYGFFTNHWLRARDFFDLTGGPANFPIISNGIEVILDGRPLAPANPSGGEDEYNRRQYGFVLGGPIGKEGKSEILSDSDSESEKNRAYFFVSFERQEIDATKESHFAAPDIAARGLFGSGDKGLLTPQGANLYPSSVTGDAVLSFYPFPNNPRGPYAGNTYTQVLPANARGSVFSVRVDQTINPRRSIGPNDSRNSSTITGRYNFTDDDTILPTVGGALFSSLRASVRTQNLSLFNNGSFTSNLTNEIRASYGRTTLGFQMVDNAELLQSRNFPDDPFLLNRRLIVNATLPDFFCNDRNYMGTIEGQPCFITQPIDTEATQLGSLGQIHVSGYSPVGADVFNFPQQRTNNTYQIADTLFYRRGRHLTIAGFDLRRTQLNSRMDRNFRPLAVFSGAPDVASRFGFSRRSPNGYYLGSDFAAVGAPTGFFQTLALTPDSTIGLRYGQTDFFLSHEIRIKSSLTFTFGARYQRNTVPGEVNKRIESALTSPQIARFIEVERSLGDGSSGFEDFLSGRRRIFEADNDNFAPHLAFAWSPFNNRSISIRAGYGIYYDQIPGAVTSQSRSVFPSFLTVNLAGLVDPNMPNSTEFFAFNPSQLAATQNGRRTLNTYDSARFGDDLTAFLLFLNRFAASVNQGRSKTFPGGPGFVLPAADILTPSAQHWGLSIEKEFGEDFFISAAYVGTKGTHLLRFATPNLGPNVIPVVTDISTRGFEPVFQGFSASPGRMSDRPFPFLGSYTSIEADANSSYHSLQVAFNKRLSRGIQFNTAYTWSHAIDETSDLFDLAGGTALPQNSFNRREERSSANFDIRHNLVFSAIWNLPNLFKIRMLNGWSISGIGAFHSGQPFTLLACCDVNLDGNASDRVSDISGIRLIEEGRKRFESNSDQFSMLGAPGNDGIQGRNTFRSSGRRSIDLAINKTFAFNERHKLELRFEFFNLFNATHFGIPVNQMLFPSFGQSVDTRLPPTTIQVSGKYNF